MKNAPLTRDQLRTYWVQLYAETGECLLWTGRTAGGYGVVSLDGRDQRVHRLAWEREHGPIPPGVQVQHKCDSPACYRTDHLKLGTAAENTEDMLLRGRGHREQWRRFCAA